MSDKTTAYDFEKAFRAIDPKTLLSFFRVDSFSDWIQSQGFDQLEPGTIMKMQQERLQAFTKANEAAVNFYRTQLERQAQLFDDVIRAAWSRSGQRDVSEGTKASGSTLERQKAAVETAIKLMQRYSEETALAAQQAFEKVSAEYQTSLNSSPKT